MDVAKNHAERHSEEDFAKQFLTLVDSGAGVIHVRTHEVMRVLSSIRRTTIIDGGVYREWDLVNGFRVYDGRNLNDEAMKGDGRIDIADAFSEPLNEMRAPTFDQKGTRYFVFNNPHVFIENNPHMQQLLLIYNNLLPSSRICVVLVTPDIPLPAFPESDSILALHFATPGLAELNESLTSVLDSSAQDFEDGVTLSKDERDRVCYVGAGMTALQFETFISLSAVKAGREGSTELAFDSVVREVRAGKTEIVNSSDILELYPSAEMSSVGGMENLKDWVNKRSRCYSDEAIEFGISPPKGIVLVGVPGSGKSLVGKAISSVLGVPLVRLDFGRVFNSLVGASEQRIRGALRQVEMMAPLVLLVDEIDKGLGGIAGGSGGDSGVSMRVLGSFLTWLQDSTAPVFTMVTANNVDGLPPELMRRGRFDAIFSTSMPTAAERYEVLRIHLGLRHRNIKDFPDAEVQTVIDRSDRYVPAELESAVKDALVDAFSAGEELQMKHVLAALEVMVPLSKAFAPQIEKMDTWARNNATPVSMTDEQRKSMRAQSVGRTRVSARRRT